MLALRGLDARIRPERGPLTYPPKGITWPRPVSGSGTTLTPARLEREPRATRHRLNIVAFYRVDFLLPLLQRGERVLLLIRALFPFMQLARPRPDLPTAIGTEEV